MSRIRVRRPEAGPPPEPWRSFLRDLDSRLSKTLELHCIGGFVVTQMFGISRATSDIDILPALPAERMAELRALAGEGSDLHGRHRVYIEAVTVVTWPVEYRSRLTTLWRQLALRHLRLRALEPHDLALTKLERNLDVDRQDVQELARRGHLDPETLRRRYETELRPYITTRPERCDLTMDLWVEMCWPKGDRPP